MYAHCSAGLFSTKLEGGITSYADSVTNAMLSISHDQCRPEVDNLRPMGQFRPTSFLELAHGLSVDWRGDSVLPSHGAIFSLTAVTDFWVRSALEIACALTRGRAWAHMLQPTERSAGE